MFSSRLGKVIQISAGRKTVHFCPAILLSKRTLCGYFRDSSRDSLQAAQPIHFFREPILNIVALAGSGLLIMLGLFTIYWLIQLKLGDSGIVDVFWGASVALVGAYFCASTSGNLNRRLVAVILMSVWAIRLGCYLWQRWKSHNEEDPRYTSLKQKWGRRAQLRMLRFYQMQAAGAFLFALTMLVVGLNTKPWGWLDSAAVVVWVISILGEAISDLQLHRFRQEPQNKTEVCQVGFWKYSRHPNYFFEWLHWWTYALLALQAPLGWLTILAPVAMWFFLNRVTGIPHTETQAIKSRGDKYRAYQQTTSAFFPWFPKQSPLLNDVSND